MADKLNELDALLGVIKNWMVNESGPTRMKFSHPNLQVRVTIMGYRKIILERTFPTRLSSSKGKGSISHE